MVFEIRGLKLFLLHYICLHDVILCCFGHLRIYFSIGFLMGIYIENLFLFSFILNGY